jgi:hypothetical protein
MSLPFMELNDWLSYSQSPHWIPPLARRTRSTFSIYLVRIHFRITPSPFLCIPSDLFSSHFPTKNCLHPHFPLRITCQTNLNPLYLITLHRRFPLCASAPRGAVGYLKTLFFFFQFVCIILSNGYSVRTNSH